MWHSYRSRQEVDKTTQNLYIASLEVISSLFIYWTVYYYCMTFSYGRLKLLTVAIYDGFAVFHHPCGREVKTLQMKTWWKIQTPGTKRENSALRFLHIFAQQIHTIASTYNWKNILQTGLVLASQASPENLPEFTGAGSRDRKFPI